MQRKVNVVEDLDGNKIVFIHDADRNCDGERIPRKYENETQ